MKELGVKRAKQCSRGENMIVKIIVGYLCVARTAINGIPPYIWGNAGAFT